MPDVGVLILAAGASTRMGKPKQLLPWKNTTLLGHAIGVAESVSENVLVVLGANSKQVATTIPNHIRYKVNMGWRGGMGTSIAKGVSELEKTTNPLAILILLSDQPLIDDEYLRKMALTLDKTDSRIVATKYGDGIGVPAIFPKRYLNDLKKLDKDFGAKQLLQSYKKHVVALNADGKAIDLDTQENYNNFHVKYGIS